MSYLEGVQIFYSESGDLDTAVLAASSLVSLDQLIASSQRNLILKNIRTIWHADFPDVNDRVYLVLFNNDYSVTEVMAGAMSTTLNVEDARDYPLAQADARAIWDIQPLPPGRSAGDVSYGIVEWKLPPKGLPVPEGGGVSIGVANMDTGNALTNGPLITSITKFMGAWF